MKFWKNTSTLDKLFPELLGTVDAAEAEAADADDDDDDDDDADMADDMVNEVARRVMKRIISSRRK